MSYKIADTVFSLASAHRYSHALLADYGSELPPELEITVTEADVLAEKAYFEAPVSDRYAESVAVLRRLCDALLDKDTLLFHGSAVAVDGETYLFAAPSGTGKSTHARLWRQLFGSRAVMVNDDKPFIHLGAPCLVYGSPWDGKERLSTNTVLPLKAVCLLERGEENRIEPISPEEALPRLLQQAYREEAMDRILPLILRLADSVPLYRLRCNMEPEAAFISWQGMNP